MVPGQRPFAREVEVDALVRPGARQVGGAADRRGAASHDDHRVGGGQAVVSGAQIGVDLGGRLQVRPAPEAVGDSGRDDERVVLLVQRRAVVTLNRDGSVSEVEPSQRAVDGSNPVESAEPVERDPVVTGPVVGAAQPNAQLLATDQRGLGRDSDDVGVTGEVDRGKDTAVAEAGDRRRACGSRRGLSNAPSWRPGNEARYPVDHVLVSRSTLQAARLHHRNAGTEEHAPASLTPRAISHHASAGEAATPNSARANQKPNSPK